MKSVSLLARQANALNRAAGAPDIPSLFFFTDPVRTPDPCAIAETLPRGAAIVFRHFGAENRETMARALARIARRRRLVLLIAADPALAAKVRADGVHWPEARAGLRARGLNTMAAHSPAALARAGRLGMDAAILSPIFPTRSASGHAQLGPVRGGQIARGAPLPVIALGGVNGKNARALRGRGFAGLAAVDALSA
jgi:thiamine-phosphate pyrophosphorylase